MHRRPNESLGRCRGSVKALVSVRVPLRKCLNLIFAGGARPQPLRRYVDRHRLVGVEAWSSPFS